MEDIAFSLDDLTAVAAAAARVGLPLRVHADQLGPSGAAEAAVALGARSADHLNHLSLAGVEALGDADGTVAVLLPASSFMLGAQTPPVDALRRAGAALAIAHRLQPRHVARVLDAGGDRVRVHVYGLRPMEALTAATANPAFVLGMDDRLGTLEVGKRADVLLLEDRRFAQVPYRPGHDPVVATLVGGELVA